MDYTALDVKTSPAKYDLACGGSVDPDLVAASAAVLRQFGGEYELRTTAVPGLVELADIAAVGSWLGAVPRYALQQFRPGETLNPQYGLVAPTSCPGFAQQRSSCRHLGGRSCDAEHSWQVWAECS